MFVRGDIFPESTECALVYRLKDGKNYVVNWKAVLARSQRA